MAEQKAQVFNSKRILNSLQGSYVPIAAIIVVLMMFIPLPKTLIDIAMVLNIAISLVILLTVLYVKQPSDFSSFPRIILFVTMFGLALNISSTRLILTQTGTNINLLMNNQSEMVKTFAQIVTGDNLVVGFIIFIILVVVQVVVVTKGAGRVSEVSARFSLDSMNNKMFDIQNEVNSGAITAEEGELKKKRLRQEIDFYSNMDGASKFVSGNVKAGIFITVVNLIGGMITGMVFGRMSASDALQSYAKLTIGDGLLSQLPALILSFSTGILVTGSSSDESITEQIQKDFSVDGTIYIIVGGALAVLGIAFHNMSALVLIPIGAFFIYMGIRMQNGKAKAAQQEKAKEIAAKSQKQAGASPEDISPVVSLDSLSLDLGYALVPLVDREKGAELLERVSRIRREEALDLGLVVPPIRIRDSMSIDADEYSFKIRGIEVGRSKLKLGHYMCLNTGNVPKGKELTGERTKDPAFKMDAIWIPEEKRTEAERAGYSVIDPPTIIATHLTEIIRRNAADILDRQAVSDIIEKVKEKNSIVVEEVLNGNNKFTYGEIERVLKNLLEEQVSIRNMPEILATLADYAPISKNPYLLTEKVRQRLGSQICLQYADQNKVLHVLNLNQDLAEKIYEHKIEQPGQRPQVAFDPVDMRAYINAMSSSIAAIRERFFLPIVLCPDEVRHLVYASTKEMPGIVILSVTEVQNATASGVKLEILGEINVQ